MAGVGSVLAAVPAAAAAHGAGGPNCTIHWTGNGTTPEWTNAGNWAPKRIPRASDDVCIINPPLNDTVETPISVTVHSLLLGEGGSIDLRGTAAKPVTMTVTTTVTLNRVPAITAFIQMEDATLKAAQIISHEGTFFTAGNCNIISPDILFANQSDLMTEGGTTTVSSLSELSNGTLSGGASFLAGDDSTVVLPGDITHLASAHVTVLVGSVIDDPAGHNALSGLTSVDAHSLLEDANDLTLTSSNFTDDGKVFFGPGTLTVPGPFTQAQRTLAVVPGGTLKATSVTIDPGATFFHQGTVATDLINDGRVVAVGTAHVTGNYTQAPGASLVSGFGNVLRVAGTATLAGSVLAAKPLAQTGDMTPLITFKPDSLAGHFTSHPLGLRLLTRFDQIDGLLFPQIAASPTTVSPGDTVTVRGGGFTITQTVSIFLDHARGTPLATQIIDAFGNIKVPVTIPASAAAGPHRLIAVESDGNGASAAITVR